MGIECLYDDGYPRREKRPYPEDGHLFLPRGRHELTVAVMDGVSFWLPSEGPALFEGYTQGQLAVRVLTQVLDEAKPGDPLAGVLTAANNRLGELAERYGIPLSQPERLPGADVAVASVSEHEISIISCGDSGAVWQMRDGSFGGTPNQAYEHELQVERTFAEIKEKHEGDLDAAWKEWLPIRRAWVRERQNRQVPGGWATLTGQPEFVGLWHEDTLPRDQVSLLMLYTDGFVNFEDTRNPVKLAEKLSDRFWQGGLRAVLEGTRAGQSTHLPRSHETRYPEATAIVVSF